MSSLVCASSSRCLSASPDLSARFFFGTVNNNPLITKLKPMKKQTNPNPATTNNPLSISVATSTKASAAANASQTFFGGRFEKLFDLRQNGFGDGRQFSR